MTETNYGYPRWHGSNITLLIFERATPVFQRSLPQSCDLFVSAEQVYLKCVSENVREAEFFNCFMDYIKLLKTTEGIITTSIWYCSSENTCTCDLLELYIM